MDFEFVKTSLSAKGYDVVYDINGNASNSAGYKQTSPHTNHFRKDISKNASIV